MANIKYKENGEYKDIVVKVGDTLPIGAEVDYDGTEVPNGWEEVDDPNEYSTTEQVVGKWINGKPLYRKVITIDKTKITAQTVSVAHGISSIGVVVRKDFIWERSNHQFRDFPSIYYANNNWSGQIFLDDTYVNFELGTTLLEQINQNALYCYVIVEYTKTTD